ncbi:MAG: hypothetical protein WBE26_12875 [Phycisphaerae bacterium]
MTRTFLVIAIASLIAAIQVMADDETSNRQNTKTSNRTATVRERPGLTDLAALDAYQAVREGNRLLMGGRPTAALEAYSHAEELEPDAREIAFAQGLAHYKLKEFDQAREAFRKTGAVANDSFADDALYSLGTCDHVEALENLENPQLALSLFEDAMRRYHEVLDRQPGHEAARDANRKAASMWRELKQQMQQQEQTCDQNQDQDQDDNEEKQDSQQQQQDGKERQQDDEQAQPQDQDEQQQEQQQSESSDGEEEQQARQQQSQAEKQERASREQAERQLREMMQALRERKKLQREPMRKIPVAPVDKDW